MRGIWTAVLALAAAIPSLLLGGCGTSGDGGDSLEGAGNSSDREGFLPPIPGIGSGGDGDRAVSARGAARDAQFLMQATFGPTQAALRELSGMSYMGWIKKQVALPVESHRAFWRQRVAPAIPETQPTAAVMDRCATGARWIQYAIRHKDNLMGQARVEVKSNELYINGQFRTNIDPNFVGNHLRRPSCTNNAAPGQKPCSDGSLRLSAGDQCKRFYPLYCRQACWDAGQGETGEDCGGWSALASQNFKGILCWAVDAVGGVVALDVVGGNCRNPTYVPNPGIFLRDTSKAANAGGRVFFTEGSPGILSVSRERSPCPFGGYRFITFGGSPAQYFMADDRLGLVENTVRNAAVAPDAAVCMNVPMSFVNKADCKIQASCQPAGESGDNFDVSLDGDARALFFTAARKYVYEVQNLKHTQRPCGRSSRWAQCSSCSPSSLSSSDRSSIANKLGSQSGWLRDITASCSNVPAGAVVEAGGRKFKNVHPNEHDVYDFSMWVDHHPGGMVKIEKWAKEDFVLKFPASHDMDRWSSNSNGRYIDRIGRADQRIKYLSLPSNLKTNGVKRAFGQSAAGTFWAACGSPNEVGTDGRFGHRFRFIFSQVGSSVFIDGEDEGRRENHYTKMGRQDGRGRVWMHHAVFAKDQLRQRVAWALAQTFVVSAENSGSNKLNTELYLNYYDIFLRHSFGSFYDLLREVTYSPIMGDYLTFIEGQSFDIQRRNPDENYAREIMQLFTIGLVMLNQDGTRVGSGDGVPTYTNEHIMDFARVFTGFTSEPQRANYEENRNFKNPYDPMRQHPKGRHDQWPKRNLYGGYIGDGFPVCADTPKLQYLAQFAEYEYAGTDSSGKEKVLTLPSNSHLYRFLCSPTNGRCSHSMMKRLPAKASCVGVECGFHAKDLLFVKVGSAFYAFKRPRCVYLSFPMGQVSVDLDEEGKLVDQIGSKWPQISFNIAWLGTPATGSPCRSPCSPNGIACRCPGRSSSRALFSRLPRRGEEMKRLSVGGHQPSIAPFSRQSGMEAYHPNGKFDQDTVFKIDGRLWRNIEYVVDVNAPGNVARKLRNPVRFQKNSGHERKLEVALHEVDALLDHLTHHPNTAPFFAIRLIQRLVTSNPSPAYVRAVAQAFTTGAAVDENGASVKFTGNYGDIGAAAAATLLHSEARASQGSTVGAMREPVVKIAHYLRAMEYDSPNREQYGTVISIKNLASDIDQWPFESTTVFNFFSPFFRPNGFDGRNVPKELVAPEFQIFTPATSINFLNGMVSTIDSGEISSCGGWGYTSSACSRGMFFFSVNESSLGSNARANVDKLDLLLTGSRMSPRSKDTVEAAYARAPQGRKLKAAQVAAIMTPEFNALGAPLPRGLRPPAPAPPARTPRNYKAMVMVFMHGGADTWNMLVPHTSCSLYGQYRGVREDVALSGDDMLQISASGQPCGSFGVHNAMPGVKSLYDKGQLAFVSNIGSLVQPMSKQSYQKKNVTRCQGLFSHSDQVNGANTLQCQVPGSSPGGFGGRMSDEFARSGFATSTFSINSRSTWPVGKTNKPIILSSNGAPRLRNYAQHLPVVENITRTVYDNIYLEEYAQSLGEGIKSSEEFGIMLNRAVLKTDIANKDGLAKQLALVSKLISLRGERKAERDLFYVVIGGWDHHRELKESLRGGLGQVDGALSAFASEMEAQGVWQDVVVATSSDFGRTLTSNGQGTDHAWAGNHIVLGGRVNGRRVLNEFPRELKKGGVQDIGRGRLVPKYPWESMMQPIAEWLGVTDAAALDRTFPNRRNFPQSAILSRTAMFK